MELWHWAATRCCARRQRSAVPGAKQEGTGYRDVVEKYVICIYIYTDYYTHMCTYGHIRMCIYIYIELVLNYIYIFIYMYTYIVVFTQATTLDAGI